MLNLFTEPILSANGILTFLLLVALPVLSVPLLKAMYRRLERGEPWPDTLAVLVTLAVGVYDLEAANLLWIQWSLVYSCPGPPRGYPG